MQGLADGRVLVRYPDSGFMVLLYQKRQWISNPAFLQERYEQSGLFILRRVLAPRDFSPSRGLSPFPPASTSYSTEQYSSYVSTFVRAAESLVPRIALTLCSRIRARVHSPASKSYFSPLQK